MCLWVQDAEHVHVHKALWVQLVQCTTQHQWTMQACQSGDVTNRVQVMFPGLTWMCLAAARALRSSLRAAMPL